MIQEWIRSVCYERVDLNLIIAGLSNSVLLLLLNSTTTQSTSATTPPSEQALSGVSTRRLPHPSLLLRSWELYFGLVCLVAAMFFCLVGACLRYARRK